MSSQNWWFLTPPSFLSFLLNGVYLVNHLSMHPLPSPTETTQFLDMWKLFKVGKTKREKPYKKILYLNSDRKRIGQSISKNFINEKFRKQFYFFICILPDYLCHEILKEFWKNSHFENMRADFLRRCQKSIRQTSPEMMHFQAWKNNILIVIMSLLLIQLGSRPTMHLKMTIWISVLWKMFM